MSQLNNRFVLFLSQLFFTGGLIPLLVLPKLASARIVRQAIVHSFGRMLAPRYHQIIGLYGSTYGEALARGLKEAGNLAEGEIKNILDCGTGTGFAARQAASAFPRATVTGVDLVPQMIEQAQQNAEGQALGINYVRADILHLPWGDATMDVVMAQNTAPYLDEFARVCRPGEWCSLSTLPPAGLLHSPATRPHRRGVLMSLLPNRRGLDSSLPRVAPCKRAGGSPSL